MHDNHEPSCALCAAFVFPFGAGSPLADWGYCAKNPEGVTLSPEDVARIEAQVERGDYSFLQDERLPLYEALGEGCEAFEDTGHHH